MRKPIFPKRKCKLTPQGKAVAAASVLMAISEGTMDDKQAGRFLRDRVGLNWSLLTAIQYLTGQEAIGALEALPAGWSEHGLDKTQLGAAVVMAHDMAANLHPTSALSAGLLVKKFKRSFPE
jgi:hypothetical protein